MQINHGIQVDDFSGIFEPRLTELVLAKGTPNRCKCCQLIPGNCDSDYVRRLQTVTLIAQREYSPSKHLRNNPRPHLCKKY